MPNNREAGDLRRHGAHYDVIIMYPSFSNSADANIIKKTCIMMHQGHFMDSKSLVDEVSNQ